MRRSDHPSRPKAMTCCFFSSLKTLLTSTEGIALASTQRPECWLIVGRFSGDYAWPVLGDHRGRRREHSRRKLLDSSHNPVDAEFFPMLDSSVVPEQFLPASGNRKPVGRLLRVTNQQSFPL